MLDLEEVSARQCRAEYRPLGVELPDRYQTILSILLDSMDRYQTDMQSKPAYLQLLYHSLTVRCVQEVLVGRTPVPGTVGGLSWLGMDLLGI